MTTTSRLELKTAQTLPPTWMPARPAGRCLRARRTVGHAATRAVFTCEDALFALTLLVSSLGTAACFFWVWQ